MPSDLLTSTAFGAALVFGFRHGFDWDHLAALTDLTGSQRSSRRSMWLATLYALGHALMVVVLGLAAILFAERVPDALDAAMERLVGVSLLALAGWIIWTAVRTRGAPPLRSRWMIVISAVRRVARRRTDGKQVVVIEHSHRHDHDHPMHEHPHHDQEVAPEGGRTPIDVSVRHSHRHRHVATVPPDPFASYSERSAFGIGVIHGVGAETPTQVLVFAAAANAGGRGASVGILACFVVGLVAANTVVAAGSTLGFRRVLARPAVAIAIAGITAAFSLVVGSLLLAGQGAALPAFPGT